jgi:ABC-2 type transport system ATP-binding protein
LRLLSTKKFNLVSRLTGQITLIEGGNQMKSLTQVEYLVKKYAKADRSAVDNISFGVKEGEFFAFLGPNGAGKTTTISILMTTFNKTPGSVKIAGYDLDTQEKQAHGNIGIIFQKPSLDLDLSAEENIRIHVSMYGIYPYRPFFKMMPGESNPNSE